MRLSFGMLCYYLSARWPLQCFPGPDAAERFLPPQFYDVAHPPAPEALVVADGDSLPVSLQTEGYCLICSGEPPAVYKKGRVGLILLEGDAGLHTVFNFIQQVYLRLQGWEEDIRQMVDGGASLQALLECSAPILENRLTVTDPSMEVVATTYRADRNENEDPNAPMLKMRYEHLPNPRQVRKVAKTALEYRGVRTAYLWWDEDMLDSSEAYPTLCINLYDDNIIIGNLTMLPAKRAFLPHDTEMLEWFAPYVQRLLIYQQEVNSGRVLSLGDFCRSLLGENPVDPAKLPYLLHMSGFAADEVFCCLVICLPSSLKLENGMFLQRQVRAKFSSAITFFHAEDLVIVLPRTQRNALEDALGPMLEELSLFAGVSEDFSDLMALPHYYHEAQSAVELELRNTRRRCLSHFSSHRGRFILENCSGGLPPQLLYPAGFVRVLEYDKNSSVSYADTLKAYLDADRNAAEAARQLYISRNSLLARLEKLEDMLQLDLDDPDVRFYLNLCLRLEQLRQAGPGR